MTERISIFNYEAYYLDYLEGNLSDADSKLLLEFLHKHPELMVDDVILPELETISLTYNDKAGLKESSESDIISSENVEVCMIAELEGVLSDEKKKELTTYIDNNTSIANDRALYSKSVLSADLNLTYKNKNSLKKKKTEIVLWPYFSGIAAASIVAFFYLFGLEEGSRSSGALYTILDLTSIDGEQIITPEINDSETFLAIDDATTFEHPSNHTNYTDQDTTRTNNLDFQNDEHRTHHNLVNHKLRPISTYLPREVVPITAMNFPEDSYEEPQADNAMASFNDMKNPIKPITQLISDKTNTEVDFRSRKKSDKKAGGFFVKIGKFELSRKKH